MKTFIVSLGDGHRTVQAKDCTDAVRQAVIGECVDLGVLRGVRTFMRPGSPGHSTFYPVRQEMGR